MKVCACLALFCAMSMASPANDWVIVPGERIGPISAGTSPQELLRLGGENKAVDTGEGPEPAIVVFGNDPSAAIAIIRRHGRLDSAMVCFERQDGPCKWHTRNGVSLGTGLAQLEKLNGGPFGAEPWGTDAGGNITSWEGGRLARSFGDKGAFKILLTLGWENAAHNATDEQTAAEAELERKHEARSNDAAMRELRPEVRRIVVVFKH